MNIALKDISKSGDESVFKNRYKSEELDLNIDRFIKLEYVDAEIKVKFKDNKLDVKVNYLYNGKFRCVRCLEEFERHIKNSVYLKYDLSFDQEFLDITEDIRNEIILSYPSKPLCKDDCKGLCPVCGKNLNLYDCDCEKQELNNSFSKLTK